jgi:hypothetical protein
MITGQIIARYLTVANTKIILSLTALYFIKASRTKGTPFGCPKRDETFRGIAYKGRAENC